jgi:hypothetical protein
MTGKFHVRMVAGLLLTLGGLIALGTAILFFLDGEDVKPISLIGTFIDVGLAVWLLRGSNAASYFISGISIITIGAWLISITSFHGDALDVAFIAVGFVVSGYCWWAVTFSKKVRAELARRRDANKIRDRAERRKFYQQAGETIQD